MWNNSNLRRKDEQREHYEHKECQYKGSIENDDKSIVAVSLCDGMVSLFIQQHFLLPFRHEEKMTLTWNIYPHHLLFNRTQEKTSFSIFLNSIRFGFIKSKNKFTRWSDRVNMNRQKLKSSLDSRLFTQPYSYEFCFWTNYIICLHKTVFLRLENAVA